MLTYNSRWCPGQNSSFQSDLKPQTNIPFPVTCKWISVWASTVNSLFCSWTYTVICLLFCSILRAFYPRADVDAWVKVTPSTICCCFHGHRTEGVSFAFFFYLRNGHCFKLRDVKKLSPTFVTSQRDSRMKMSRQCPLWTKSWFSYNKKSWLALHP